MKREEAKSCIGTIEMLQRLAYNIHGVMDVIDADNCNKIIKALEQEPILDKIRAEIVDTLYVDSLIFGELIDFKNGKIDADDVIEEFNRVTRMEVLRIIDKYKLESEGKE